ncbi:MAG: hypothetical protein IJZ79_07200 [Bacilli bacterium]|nr:hypothetical protein [Bacilli bacterium]
MNNKGFAITTILYGTLILFMLLFLSLLGILSQYKSNLEKLVDNVKGTRGIVTLVRGKQMISSGQEVMQRGFYSIDNGTCYRYLTVGEKATCVK